MRMTDVHTVAPSGAGGAHTFDLVSLLQLPAGRMTTANVRWVLAPMALPGGAPGVQARVAGSRAGPQMPSEGRAAVAENVSITCDSRLQAHW